MAQLKGEHLGEELLLPINVLRSGERVLLDDYTVEDISSALQVPVNIVKSSGYDFTESLLGKFLTPVRKLQLCSLEKSAHCQRTGGRNVVRYKERSIYGKKKKANRCSSWQTQCRKIDTVQRTGGRDDLHRKGYTGHYERPYLCGHCVVG